MSRELMLTGYLDHLAKVDAAPAGLVAAEAALASFVAANHDELVAIRDFLPGKRRGERKPRSDRGKPRDRPPTLPDWAVESAT